MVTDILLCLLGENYGIGRVHAYSYAKLRSILLFWELCLRTSWAQGNLRCLKLVRAVASAMLVQGLLDMLVEL